MPTSIWDIEARTKDIRFSSRTRLNTEVLRNRYDRREADKRLYAKLPADLRDDPDARALLSNVRDPEITMAHLIYRQTQHEKQLMDYEFSRASVRDHWRARNLEWSGGVGVARSYPRPGG